MNLIQRFPNIQSRFRVATGAINGVEQGEVDSVVMDLAGNLWKKTTGILDKTGWVEQGSGGSDQTGLAGLTHVGTFMIDGAQGISQLALDELVDVGSNFIATTSSLDTISLASLISVGGSLLLYQSDNGQPSEINLPLLVTVGGDFLISSD